MKSHIKIATALLAFCFALLGFYPQSYVVGLALVGAIALFGYLQFLDRKKLEGLELFESRFKDLQDKIQALMIGRVR